MGNHQVYSIALREDSVRRYSYRFWLRNKFHVTSLRDGALASKQSPCNRRLLCQRLAVTRKGRTPLKNHPVRTGLHVGDYTF
jgi:hypothetical protein